MSKSFLALLAGLSALMLLAVGPGCDDPNTADDDAGGGDDDDDSIVDPTPYAFTVVAPVPLEAASVDGFECVVDEDGFADCEVGAVSNVPLKGEATNMLFVDLATTVDIEGNLWVNHEMVCDLGDEEDCVVGAWGEQYQYCLAPSDVYISSVFGDFVEIETFEVDGECRIVIGTFQSVMELTGGVPVDFNSFNGPFGDCNNINNGSISADLGEIYYHSTACDGSEFEEWLYLE